MVPDGWKTVRLGELFHFKNGLNADKSRYWYGTKFVNIMDVFDNNFLYASDVVGSVQVGENQLKDYSVQRGDVLFNRTSEIPDEIAMSSVYVDPKEEITFGGFVIRGRPITDGLLPDFSIYCFQAANVRRELIRRGQGAVRTNIGQSDLEKVPILVPPPSEQTKIAEILLTWDQAITVTEQFLTKTEDQKKALLYRLLTQPEATPRDDGIWKIARFDDLYFVANDSKAQIKSSEYLESGETAVVDQSQSLVAGYTNHGRTYTETPVIVFGDHTRTVKWVDFDFCPGADGTQVIRTRESIDAKFGYYLLCNARLPNLGYSRHMRELKEKEFWYPTDQDVQRYIAQLLTLVDYQTDRLRQRLTYLRQEKHGLMQQLLTGKRRVKVDEEQAA